jgi:hypothetical protein
LIVRRRRPSNRILPGLLAGAAALWAGVPSVPAQCAMCNTAVDGAGAGRAFSVSILFLLGTLFALVAWLAVLAARAAAARAPAPDDDGAPEMAFLPDRRPGPGAPTASRGR